MRQMPVATSFGIEIRACRTEALPMRRRYTLVVPVMQPAVYETQI